MLESIPVLVPLTVYGWPLTSIVLQALMLGVGISIGYLMHYLHSHSARSQFESDERRKIFTEKIPIPENIEHIQEWLPNVRGALLFRQQLIPAGHLKGVIGICHGFMDHTNSCHTDLAIRFCQQGYAVVMMDAEGHGLSDGIYGYIRSIDDIVGDCSDFFIALKATDRYANLPLFVYGESMGGAVAFNLCTKSPSHAIIQGAILVAPMLKIADDMMIVPRCVIEFLRSVIIPLIPYAPLTPVKDVLPYCFKTEEAFREAKCHSLHFDMKPRLGSAMAMIDATKDISGRLSSLAHRVLIIHGGADTVTCPSMSTDLYHSCQSKDKLLKIYPGCLHGLMKAADEPKFPEIFADILEWLQEEQDQDQDQDQRGERGTTRAKGMGEGGGGTLKRRSSPRTKRK